MGLKKRNSFMLRGVQWIKGTAAHIVATPDNRRSSSTSFASSHASDGDNADLLGAVQYFQKYGRMRDADKIEGVTSPELTPPGSIKVVAGDVANNGASPTPRAPSPAADGGIKGRRKASGNLRSRAATAQA
jgi:hypothetical protein